jgi:hypothetical protein
MASEAKDTGARDTGAREACCVCLEDLGDKDVLKTPCCHSFHGECLIQWLDTQEAKSQPQTCPLCRRVLLKVLEEDLTEDARGTYRRYADRNGIRLNRACETMVVGALGAELLFKSLGVKDVVDLSGFTQSLHEAVSDGPGRARLARWNNGEARGFFDTPLCLFLERAVTTLASNSKDNNRDHSSSQE